MAVLTHGWDEMAATPVARGASRVKRCRVCGKDYQVRPREKPERDWCHDWRCEEEREEERRLAARAARQARGR